MENDYDDKNGTEVPNRSAQLKMRMRMNDDDDYDDTDED